MDAIKLLKDAFTVDQKSNDIEMVQKIISAQEEVLNMQSEITKLQNENKKLKEKVKVNKNVERYRNIPIITLKNDKPKILYCANCFVLNDRMVQLQIIDNNKCYCRNCDNYFYINNSPDADIIKRGIDGC